MGQHLNTLQTIYRAFSQGDIATILARLAPDVQWEHWPANAAQAAGVPWLAHRQGVEGVQAFFGVLASQLRIQHFEVRDMLAGERQAVADVVLDCEVVSTGRRLRDEELHLWSFDEQGRVQRLRHYVDTARQIAAAGLPG